VVVDSSAPFVMGQILHKIFKRKRYREVLFGEDVLFVSTMVDERESWKRNLLERVRKIIKQDPVFRAEVIMNSTDSSMELGLISSGDDLFFEHLVDVRKSIDKRSGLVSEVRNIQGGLWKYNPDFKPSQFFLPGDYDQSDPLRQWSSQQPLGHQSVFQLEPEEGESDATVSQGQIRHSLEITLSAMKYDAESELKLEEFTDSIGDGCVFVAIWSGGSVVVVWDGRKHIDINLFTYVESVKSARKFADYFKKEMKIMKTVLHDEQPRGYGGVVNFLKDIEPRADPHWSA